ncbi:ribonuclease G [Levilactobacillus bambusae]|uniref:Ribonuclease G n=1 Tax=Levilactobacillus bambusae TaxID=2024736 RepID=A0A2V1N2L2_9LACO|nr:ribonuclease G [Levilactobacillus bambusae]PWG00848.1 ribonuclease G [Levilactobacillus bambusae]
MQENSKVTPQEIKGWNWGAFMFSWIWGIGNKTYLPLLNLIPVFNIVWIFVTGFKGNEWAWQKGNYDSIDTFKQVQATWSRAGLVKFLLVIVGIILYFIFVAGMVATFLNNY